MKLLNSTGSTVVLCRLIAAFGSACLAAVPVATTATPTSAAAAEPARIFFLNSYHEGYAPSDDIMAGVRDTLQGKSVVLQTFFLDSKRQPSSAAIESNAVAALAAIQAFRPDVLIVSDDDAVKHVVVPHFKQGPFPVVFCGVNWSCEQYGLPTANVTGMLEVVPIEEAIKTMQGHYSPIRRFVVLSEDSTSERSNRELLDPLYRRLKLDPVYMLVSDFSAWKSAFVHASANANLIYLPTNGAIQGWNHDEAVAWIHEHIRTPVITCDDFMMPYAVFGLTKVAREQGEWAAQTALAILGGKSPANIPVTSNSQTRAFLNEKLARRIEYQPQPEVLRQVGATGTARPQPAAVVSATVDFGARLRSWDGFGVNYVETCQTHDYRKNPQDYGAFERLTEAQRQEIVAQIFGEDGLKPGLLKMFLDPFHEGYTKAGNDNNDPRVINPAGFDHTTTTRWMRYFAREGLAHTRARGGDLQIITTLYGPPPRMTKQKIMLGRDLDPDKKYELAEYMISWAKYLREVEGLPVKYISLHNEGESSNRWPEDGGIGGFAERWKHQDYNMHWPAKQIVDFLRFMREMLDEQGMQEVGLTPGETARWRGLYDFRIADSIAEDPQAIENLALITSHGFAWGKPAPHRYGMALEVLRAKRPELHAWTTSMSWRHSDTQFVSNIRKEIYDAGVNGIIPWAVVQLIDGWQGGDPNPDTAFNIDDQGRVRINPAYYFYKQVSRAGQPGMAVALVEAADEDIELIAFSRNGTSHPDAFIVINLGETSRKVSVQVKGSDSRNYNAFRTTEDGRSQYTHIGDVAVVKRAIGLEAPAGSVTTFFAR